MGYTTPFGFVGKEQYHSDSDSGLQLLGHRYYDSSSGRFLSRDPAKAGTNWYAYCENNPLGGIDPEGLQDNKKTPPAPPPFLHPKEYHKIYHAGPELVGTEEDTVWDINDTWGQISEGDNKDIKSWFELKQYIDRHSIPPPISRLTKQKLDQYRDYIWDRFKHSLGWT